MFYVFPVVIVFQAFAIFCGLGINNCMLYDEVTRSAAKQAVALEVFSLTKFMCIKM